MIGGISLDVVYFIYDGVNSEDYGYCIASFDGNTGVSGVTTDSQRDFNQIVLSNGALHPFTCSTYNDCLEMSFSVIKDPCKLGNDSGVLSVNDMRFLKRWLNRPSAHKFAILDKEYEGMFWEGSCNIEEAVYAGERVGINVTLITNRPYGLFEPIVEVGAVDSEEPLRIVTGSDEIGGIYPEKMEITCKEAGNLTVYNSVMPDRIFVVKNCVVGETITIDSTLQITSNKLHSSLPADCNYKFPMLYTQFDNDINDFYSSIPTDITITFMPIAKVVIV